MTIYLTELDLWEFLLGTFSMHSIKIYWTENGRMESDIITLYNKSWIYYSRNIVFYLDMVRLNRFLISLKRRP